MFKFEVEVKFEAKFESDQLLKTNEDIARKVAQFYRCLYGGGQVRAHHDTNVSKISRLKGTVSSPALDTFKRGKFTNVKAIFSAVSTDFHQM